MKKKKTLQSISQNQDFPTDRTAHVERSSWKPSGVADEDVLDHGWRWGSRGILYSPSSATWLLFSSGNKSKSPKGSLKLNFLFLPFPFYLHLSFQFLTMAAGCAEQQTPKMTDVWGTKSSCYTVQPCGFAPLHKYPLIPLYFSWKWSGLGNSLLLRWQAANRIQPQTDRHPLVWHNPPYLDNR